MFHIPSYYRSTTVVVKYLSHLTLTNHFSFSTLPSSHFHPREKRNTTLEGLPFVTPIGLVKPGKVSWSPLGDLLFCRLDSPVKKSKVSEQYIPPGDPYGQRHTTCWCERKEDQDSRTVQKNRSKLATPFKSSGEAGCRKTVCHQDGDSPGYSSS